jgi:hypothetical protein
VCAGSRGDFAFEFSVCPKDADIFSGQCICDSVTHIRQSAFLILPTKYTLIGVFFLTCLFVLAMGIFHVTKDEFIPV